VPIETGTKLGPYEVQEFIGQGAMGLVYRAYHAQLERFGAVKVLQVLAAGKDAAARFRHEAQAIAQMRHPNIVNVYDFGEYEGTPYMIVEYVPGGNLAGKMQQTPMDQANALKCLHGIAAGLDYAHSLGIVHRDVKPGNVLLEKDGTPVLADFGLVKLLQGSSVQSMTGVTTGTPAYMAPEQVTGHQVGPPADRYSLATMAYEMLTGSIPFEGEGVLELLYAHVHREPPPPSSRNADLGGAVDAVILRGLAKDPAARWATSGEFVDALAAALANAQVPAPERTVVLAGPLAPTLPLAPEPSAVVAPTRRVERPSPASTVIMAMPPSAPGKARRSRRRLLEIGAGVVILLLLLLVGGICAAATQTPTLDLSPSITEPGGSVTVTATKVPANQVGQIVLRSRPTAFPFQASGNGDISEVITVPLDAGIGDHTVNLCWGGSCHVQRVLKVVAPGTLPSPTPTSNPSPTASGKPVGKPTPGKSPTPGTTPPAGTTPNPTATPRRSPSPRPTPTPTPTPTANPCPTPAAAAVLKAKPTTVVGGSSVTLTGTNFTPNKLVTLTYYKGNTVNQTWTITVSCNGSFTTSVTTVGTLVIRTDHVTARDSAGRTGNTGNITVLV
jgi:eukaryotic-like serine/threonine-protein kinase